MQKIFEWLQKAGLKNPATTAIGAATFVGVLLIFLLENNGIITAEQASRLIPLVLGGGGFLGFTATRDATKSSKATGIKDR